MRRSDVLALPATLDARGLGALVLLALIWGGSIPATKLGLADLPPLTLTALRYLFAAPLFAFILRRSYGDLRRDFWPLVLLAAINAVPGQVLQTVGVRYTAAVPASLLNATVPVWFVVLASLRLGQRLTPRQWAGLGTALAGIIVLLVGDPRDLRQLWSASGLVGNLLMLASAVSVALYYVLSVNLARRLSPVLVAGGTSLLGAAILLPFGLWELTAVPLHATARGLGVVLYLAVPVTFWGIQIWLGALQSVPASVAGALQYLQPVIGVGLSLLLLGEPFTARFAAGAALVLLGIGVVTVRRRP